MTDSFTMTDTRHTFCDEWESNVRKMRNRLGIAVSRLVSENWHKSNFLGCRVTFAEFVKWLAAGNYGADEHWTPAVDLCVPCQANYAFIGHTEHFNDDIKVIPLYRTRT